MNTRAIAIILAAPRVADLRKQGVTADETARRVDLTSHRADFPETQRVGADLRGVRRL
jgi:hypothetical protein